MVFCDGMRKNVLTPAQVQAYANLIKSYGDTQNLVQGRQLHARLSSDGQHCWSRFLSNLLVEMYGKCGQVADARRVFNGIGRPNAFSWNILMQAYALNGHIEEVESLFATMATKNDVSWSCLISSYALKGDVDGASRVLGAMPSWTNTACTAVLRAYAHHGQMQSAKSVFDAMPERDLVSWTAMQSAFADNGYVQRSADVFLKLPAVDSVCWTRLLLAYALNGHLLQARDLFDTMPERNLFAWTVMLFGYAQNGLSNNSLELFRALELEGLEPDEVALTGVLTGCSHGGLVKPAWEYFTSMVVDRGLVHMVEHFHCMVDVLGRAGRLADAEELIYNMPFEAEDIPWTSLLDACRMHGDVERGDRAAKKMTYFSFGKKAMAPYVLLSNIYADAKRQQDVGIVRQGLKDLLLSQGRSACRPGQSFLVI